MNKEQTMAKAINSAITGKKFVNKDLDNYIYASLSKPPIKIVDKNDSNDELNYTVECPNCGCYVNYGYQIFMISGYIYCNNRGCRESLIKKIEVNK